MKGAILRSISARSAAPVALLALCVGLGACGGSSSTTSPTTTPSAEGAKPAATKAKGGQASRKARPAAKARKPSALAEEKIPAKLKKEAGKVAPFLVAGGDNSIPTYGAESSSEQKQQATASLSAYFAARAKGRWVAACGFMGKSVRHQLAVLAKVITGQKHSAPCPSSYRSLSRKMSAEEREVVFRGRIAGFRVEGAKAFALFYGPHHQQYMIPMALEGGRWKVNQIGAFPWPIGAPVGSH